MAFRVPVCIQRMAKNAPAEKPKIRTAKRYVFFPSRGKCAMLTLYATCLRCKKIARLRHLIPTGRSPQG